MKGFRRQMPPGRKKPSQYFTVASLGNVFSAQTHTHTHTPTQHLFRPSFSSFFSFHLSVLGETFQQREREKWAVATTTAQKRGREGGREGVGDTMGRKIGPNSSGDFSFPPSATSIFLSRSSPLAVQEEKKDEEKSCFSPVPLPLSFFPPLPRGQTFLVYVPKGRGGRRCWSKEKEEEEEEEASQTIISHTLLFLPFHPSDPWFLQKKPQKGESPIHAPTTKTTHQTSIGRPCPNFTFLA